MAARPRVYPVSLLLEGRRCLVVGAGRAALAKIEGLLQAGAAVTVIAPDVLAAVEQLPVALVRRDFEADDLTGFHLVIAATGNDEIDHSVHAAARAHGVLANAVDNPAACDFYLPAVLRRGDISVAISTAGASPALASWIRDRVGELLVEELALVATIVGEERTELRARGASSEGLNWAALIDGLVELLRDGGTEKDARALARAWGLDAGRTTE